MSNFVKNSNIKKTLDINDNQVKDEEEGLFSLLVLSFMNAALIQMGYVDEFGGMIQNPKPVNLEQARYNISMIEMLKEKTKGNLSQIEIDLLENTMYELRNKFVESRRLR